MAKKTNNFFNDKIIGSSASGKPPAFGAGIPQVRILSTQKEVKLTSKEVSFFLTKKVLCKKQGTGFETKRAVLKKAKTWSVFKETPTRMSELAKEGGVEAGNRRFPTVTPNPVDPEKIFVKINDNLQFFTEFYSIYKI